MLTVKSITFNPFQENTYVLYDETKSCVIIDPGCYEKHEEEILNNFITENELEVKMLLNTHCHVDHVLGNKFISDTYKVKLHIHKEDLATLKSVETYGPSYGFNAYQPKDADEFFEGGDVITFGNTNLEVIFTPGHAPGHVVFFHRESKNLINGDVLFQGSIGRTDLPGGDFDTLIKSIHENVFPLGDDITVWTGHGPNTTIGEEKAHNPFCAVVQ